MRGKVSISILFLFILMITVACSGQETKPNSEESEKDDSTDVTLTISAAVSLKDAMEVIQAAYEEEHPEVQMKFNFGGSGSLQQQISQGAPVDLFFSAAEDKFELLVDEGMVAEEDGTDLVGNTLVLVVPKDDASIDSFEELAESKVDKISIGTPETVPAGKYAQESFEKLGIWEQLESKMVYAKDVRQVLSYVETGNVDAGVVYQTDALISDKVDIVATADASTHAPIIYPVGVIQDSKQYEEAKEFYEYLQSDEALEVFEEYGFTTE